MSLSNLRIPPKNRSSVDTKLDTCHIEVDFNSMALRDTLERQLLCPYGRYPADNCMPADMSARDTPGEPRDIIGHQSLRCQLGVRGPISAANQTIYGLTERIFRANVAETGQKC